MTTATPASLAPDFSPWTFWNRADDARMQDQLTYLDELRRRGHRLGEGTFVSRLAAVDADDLELGERSYVAAHCYVPGPGPSPTAWRRGPTRWWTRRPSRRTE